MTLLAVDYPPWEFVFIAVAVLIGIIGKITEFSKKLREKSIETEQQAEAQFGAEPGEAPEPQRAEAPVPRIELVRRPPRPRREEVIAPLAPLPPPPPARPPPPPPAREHEIVRLLRAPHGARNAVLLAEVLGPPKSLRRR